MKRLLVADDAMIIREMIKDAAAMAGWEVVGEASDGAVAIERYEELKPDAVTLDLVMPQFDGLHALRGIMQKDPAAKVVIVSAVNQAKLLKDAIALGASDFIVKPFDRPTIANALARLASARAK